MDKERIFEEIIEAVKNEIPQTLRDHITVEMREVIKTNDERLHGINLRIPGYDAVPTIYLEDFLKDYESGRPVKEIAQAAMDIMREGMNSAPCTDNISLRYEDIEDKLVLQVVEAERNRERLKDLVYRPAENGFVMVAYVVVEENENGNMRFAVRKDMAENYNYDVDKLLDKAAANTQERYQPVLKDMGSVILSGSCDLGGINPLKDDYTVSPDEVMYILTNENGLNGAGVLFYPDMKKRIGEILDDSYYVLPSSLHEVIIMPEKLSPDIRVLEAMVKDANRTVVESQDILSDRVFMFDREKNRMIEPGMPERHASERSAR